jgi:hypothetical protein
LQGGAVPQHYEPLEPPRSVWVKSPGDRCWYPGIGVGKLYPAWPDKRRVRFDVSYSDDVGTMYRGTVYDHLVQDRSPLAEPDKDAPCAQCGTSRELCNRRQQTERPPYCCPRCWRSPEQYALHIRT